MFLDASVIVAILANESDASELARRLDVADVRLTSPLAIWEATVAMVRIGRLTPGDAKFLVTELIASWGGEVIALDERIGSAAIEAFDAFGRGRHRAALNMGDCLAYACAKSRAVPLMCKGDEFPLTDIALA